MIPVALYGIDVEGCEGFYQQFSECGPKRGPANPENLFQGSRPHPPRPNARTRARSPSLHRSPIAARFIRHR